MSFITWPRVLSFGCSLMVCLFPALGFGVGGGQMTVGRWPWIGAMVQYREGYFPAEFCGGTLIAPQWYLTASRCVDNVTTRSDMDGLRVLLGTGNLYALFKNPKNVFRIRQVIKHEKYDRATNDNDVALIKLIEPITPSENLNVISLATADDAANARKVSQTTVIYVGWGALADGKAIPGIPGPKGGLRGYMMSLVSHSECKTLLQGSTYNEATMLCAKKNPFGEKDASAADSCKEDTGGPLVVQDKNGTNKLLGIVIRGTDCGRSNQPSVYMNVASFAPWIQATMAANK